MSQEGFPKPDKDSEIPKETEQVIDDLLGSLPKRQSMENQKLPEEVIKFPVGSVENLVCQVIIQEYKDLIFLRNKNQESWQEDGDNKEYIMPEYKHERDLFKQILADDAIKFLKSDIMQPTTREFGYALEKEGKLKKGRTRIMHNLMIDSNGEMNRQIQIEFEEIIEETIDRVAHEL